MAMCLSACGDDKDEPATLSPANAKGVNIMWGIDDAGALEVDNITLWINDYVIYTIGWNGESEMNLNDYNNQALSYEPLSMEAVYQMIGEDYGVEVDANTDFSDFHPSPVKLINYIKSNRSKYRYIAKRGGDIVLFNRTSNVNYN